MTDLAPAPPCSATDYYVNAMAADLATANKNPSDRPRLIEALVSLRWPAGFIVEILPALEKRLGFKDASHA